MSAQIRSQVASAVHACTDKKGEEISILELDQTSSAFTDYFVICTGRNSRQIQAISDEVELRLKREGTRVNQVEGYQQADWVLLDYVDFVVHVFSEASRKFYDLERLWKSARKLSVADLKKPAARAKTPAKRAATGSTRTRTGTRKGSKRASSGTRNRRRKSAS